MMILDGANKLFDNNDYTIYTMNSIVTGQYGIVVPKNINGVLNMLIDLHFKNSFDTVSGGIKTTDMLINEINEEYRNIKAKYINGLLVMPMIDETVLANVIANGDKQKMFDEVKKISAITSELYKKLIESGLEKQKIDQKIFIVEKNDSDEKFVNWLKEQTPGFIEGVLYSELNNKNNSLFNNNNNLFGNPIDDSVVNPIQNVAAVQKEETMSNTLNNVTPIENNASTESANANIEATTLTESENKPATIEAIDPLNNNVNLEIDKTQTPKVDTNHNLFESPNTVEIPSMTSIPNIPIEPMDQSIPTIANLGAIEGPKPVKNTDLEATALFNPISNNATEESKNINVNNISNNNSQNNEEELNPNKSNSGFVNLIILIVILIGVTIISIELGKYLYSVYGA